MLFLQIGAAKSLFYKEQGHPFKLDGCWLILKDSAKWFEDIEELQGRKQKTVEKKKQVNLNIDGTEDCYIPSTPVTASGSVTEPVSLSDDTPHLSDGPQTLMRPHGQKAKKNERKKRNADQLEGLQVIVSELSNMRKEQKEIAEQEIIFAKEREQMKIQAKLERERERSDKEIMMTDPNSLPTKEGKLGSL